MCSDGHEEICHQFRKCPLCAEVREREAIEKELEIVKESHYEAAVRVEELLEEVAELKDRLEQYTQSERQES